MNAIKDRLRGLWQGLARREQALLRVGLAAVSVTLLLLVGIAPAVRTLHDAPARQRQLDARLLQMQVLQARALSLQTQPQLSREEGLLALQASLRLLGGQVQIAVNGQQATVTLTAAQPDALVQWLIHARVNARAVPVEARLQRNTTATGAAWDGTLVMRLPAP